VANMGERCDISGQSKAQEKRSRCGGVDAAMEMNGTGAAHDTDNERLIEKSGCLPQR
jgi:hypothetical protein